VQTDDRRTAEETSPAQAIADRPKIKALIVGLSHYVRANPSAESISDLLHADADAETFGELLKKLLPSSADDVDIRTSHGAKELSKDAILGELHHIRETEKLCGDNDWFIFYFSGHGVLGGTTRPAQITRFLSTKAFDPADPDKTGISIVDLI